MAVVDDAHSPFFIHPSDNLDLYWLIWHDLKERLQQHNGPRIFQLKPKSEASTAIINLVKMVKTQFGALKFPEWRKAMDEEIQALEANNTWTLIILPPNKHCIGCKCIYKTKFKQDGFVERLKARLVAKGFTKLAGIDFYDTFSPVAKPTTVRTLLVVAAVKQWHLLQLDIYNAFLNGDLFVEAPCTTHLLAIHHLLKYLKQSPGQGIFFPSNSSLNMIAYADADWASCIDTQGFSIFLGNALISWKSKKQITVSKSSAETEYRSLSLAASEVIWLQRLLSHFEVPIACSMLFCDNQSAIQLASNPSYHRDRSKHIAIDYHFIRELVASHKIKLVHVKSQHQLPNVFTKVLPLPQFTTLICKPGILDIYFPP
ncbi:hypothetical protein CR513_39188, partial [Mucuna pruriens]